MDLYYKDLSPPSRAAYAVIKHLGLNVNLKEVNVMAGGTRTEEFLKVSLILHLETKNIIFIIHSSTLLIKFRHWWITVLLLANRTQSCPIL